MVRVLDDLAEVHRLQDGHGGWNDDIALVSVGRRRGRERPRMCVIAQHKLTCIHTYISSNPTHPQSLGQLGRVVVVFDSGDCRVRVNGYNWTLNPKALTPAPGETPPDVPG